MAAVEKGWKIVRVLVGLVFIVSAYFKLESIDSFEIYVYSFGLLSLNNAFLFSRVLISIELLGGLLLIFGIFRKRVIQISIAVLFLFSIFIAYLILVGNKEHCHCFGDVVELSHVSSLVKNLVLAVFLLLVYRGNEVDRRFKYHILATFVLFSFSLPFIISPPDSYFYDRYAKNDSYNKQLLDEYLLENNELNKGKKILCFFSTGCRFCKLATKKISVIADKIGDTTIVKYAFLGTEETVSRFFKETNSIHFKYSILESNRFLRLTKGQMPLILLLENGAVKGEYGYRSIDEDYFLNFFSKP